MALRGRVELVQEFQAWEDFQGHEEEVVRELRFYLYLTQRTDYWSFLTHSLEHGCDSQLELLVCAGHLAFLVNFHPEAALDDQRNKYIHALAQGLYRSERAKWGYAKLVDSEDFLMMIEAVKTGIEELTPVSYLSKLLINLDILGKKLSWEIKKRQVARCQPSQDVALFVEGLVQFLCSKKYGQNQEILMEVAKLTGLAFKYLREETNSYKSMLLSLMEHWITLKVFKKQVRMEIVKTLTISVQTLGIYKPSLFYQFFTANEGLIQEIEYLQLLAAFLGKLDKAQRLNQSEITKILRSLFTAVVQAPSGPAQQCEFSKSMQIDQIIKISTLFSCDLSKYLSQFFQEARSSSHDAFMGALMLVFDQRMSAETVRSIEPHKLKYLENSKQGGLYEQVLQRYCQEDLDLEEFIINPEQTDDFMWEFLLLRTTVAINYSALCEIDRVATLVVNLTKLMLLDIFPRECLQIIEKVVQKEEIYSLVELEEVKLGEIVMAVRPILMKQVQNQLDNDNEKFAFLFRNLGKAVQLITKRHTVRQLAGFTLFQAVISLSNDLPCRYGTQTLMKYQNQLLELAMPMDFSEISEGELSHSLESLLNHLQRYRNTADFLLYLEMMNRGIEHPRLNAIYVSFNMRVGEFMSQRHLPNNIEDSYKIIYFILSDSEFQSEFLHNSWNLLLKFDSFQYPHFFFHIIALQRYAARWIINFCSNNQSNFLRYQLGQTVELLVKLDEVVEKAVILQRVEELLCFRQTLLIFLQEHLIRYAQISGSCCDELSTANSYLLRAFYEMRSKRPSTSTFQAWPAIREYWCNCQLLVLVMASSSLRGEKSQGTHYLVHTLQEIDQKFEWVCKLYPKGHQKQLQDFALCLNCQIFELQVAIQDRLSPVAI